MEITLGFKERALANFALVLAGKRVEAIAPKMAELTLPTMELERLAGYWKECGKLVNKKVEEPLDPTRSDWHAEVRIAMLVALGLYTADLEGLEQKELKLTIEPDATRAKLGAIKDLCDTFKGQGRFAFETDHERIERLAANAQAIMDEVVAQTNAGALDSEGTTVTATSSGRRPRKPRGAS